jgi:radical SAM protein with 4Fe4S-binding SPASM domain
VGVTDTVLDFVALEGMQLMVSLDGGPLVHDQVRAGKNGRGTYAAVVDTIERALERDLRPLISITLTALNLSGAKEAVSFALERNLPFNLNFYRECLADSVASSSLVPDVTLLMEEMLDIFDVIRMYPTYPLPLTGILDRTRLDILHSYACSAGRDYLAVGTRGQISACQMLIEEPWAHLSEADPLGAVRQRGESVFTPADEHPACQSCLWRAACSGGCPLVRGTEIHTRYCLVYRALFPELIRLEASRLIANQSRCPSFSL